MRIIYRSVSKRQLTTHSPSLTREVLEHSRSYLLWVFSFLGTLRSACCRVLFYGLAWVAVSIFILPWVGPVLLVRWLCKNWAVPYLLKHLSEPDDIPETTLSLRSYGLSHVVLKFDGTPNLKEIRDKVESFVETSRGVPADALKLKLSLVRLPFGLWVWRKNRKGYDVRNQVTLWEGAPLSSRNLKYKINELCGCPLDDQVAPWHVYVVPYIQDETRAPGHALLIRAHQFIEHLFRVEDFCAFDSEERHLRNALEHAFAQVEDTSLLKEDHANEPQSDLKNVQWYNSKRFEQVLTALDLVCKAPALLLHEAMCCWKELASYRSTTGYRRALAWSDPISSELVIRLKEASRADSEKAVLLSCFAGALNHYRLISNNGDLREDTARALVPRGNGFVRIALPVGERCPKARLRRVQNSLSRGKSDAKYQLSCVLTSLWSKFLPTVIGPFFTGLLGKRYPVLVDDYRVKASDNSITEVNYWKLTPADVGLSITFVHYGGKVSLSAMSIFNTLQRPDLLVSCFDRAVLDLALAFDVRYERKPSPPPTPTKIFSGRSF